MYAKQRQDNECTFPSFTKGIICNALSLDLGLNVIVTLGKPDVNLKNCRVVVIESFDQFCTQIVEKDATGYHRKTLYYVVPVSERIGGRGMKILR